MSQCGTYIQVIGSHRNFEARLMVTIKMISPSWSLVLNSNQPIIASGLNDSRKGNSHLDNNIRTKGHANDSLGPMVPLDSDKCPPGTSSLSRLPSGRVQAYQLQQSPPSPLPAFSIARNQQSDEYKIFFQYSKNTHVQNQNSVLIKSL